MTYHMSELYRAILRKDDEVVPSSLAIAAEHLTPFKTHSNQIADIHRVPPRYPATVLPDKGRCVTCDQAGRRAVRRSLTLPRRTQKRDRPIARVDADGTVCRDWVIKFRTTWLVVDRPNL